MKMVSLFSGIGGIELGAERAGIETIIQCENNPFSLRILEKHWPKCIRYTDIKNMNPFWLRAVFPARMQAGQTTREPGSMAHAPGWVGMKCIELYASLNLNTYSLRTYQTSLIEDGGKLSGNWPRAGIIFGTGLFLLKTSDSLLKVNGFTPWFKTHDNPAGITDRAFWGDAYPEFLRKDNGLPAGSYRITALGNACIPLFPEIILSALNDLDHFINTRPA